MSILFIENYSFSKDFDASGDDLAPLGNSKWQDHLVIDQVREFPSRAYHYALTLVLQTTAGNFAIRFLI